MSILENFLKTGRLGSLYFGMPLSEILSILGSPEQQSKKMNPLLLQYGGLQLTLSKPDKQSEPSLIETVVYFEKSLPDQLTITEWEFGNEPTEPEFRKLLDDFNCPAAFMITSEQFNNLAFPSGVSVAFSNGKAHSMRVSLSLPRDNTPPPPSDDKEPTAEGILGMLSEAQRASQNDASRAGLVLAWAALEATIRRKIRIAALPVKGAVNPGVMAQLLQASRIIDHEQFTLIEDVRRLRANIAHGMATPPIDASLTERTIAIAKELLADKVETP